MKVPFINYPKQYGKIRLEINGAIEDCLWRGDLILRKDVEIFEKKLAKYVGTKYAVALNSGTDALVLSLKAVGIGKGHKVAVPSHTFKATCGAVLTVGAKPVVYDMDGRFGKVDLHIPVHIAGEIAPFSNDIPVIEDAAQAIGAIKNPKSMAQTWSFYPAKVLGAYGDAGAVTTNYKSIAEYVREARNHFKTDDRDFGQNSRMDNIQAAILNVKFQYLREYLKRRNKIADMYRKLEGVELPNYSGGRVWQDYIIRTPKRDELHCYLKKYGVETIKNEYPFSPEYPKPPLAKKYEAETLRLPCNPDLTDEEIKYVIKKVNEFYTTQV